MRTEHLSKKNSALSILAGFCTPGQSNGLLAVVLHVGSHLKVEAGKRFPQPLPFLLAPYLLLAMPYSMVPYLSSWVIS